MTAAADKLRHNYLLRRHLADPMYGVVDSDDWRQRTANGLGVGYVFSAPALPSEIASCKDCASPSEMPKDPPDHVVAYRTRK